MVIQYLKAVKEAKNIIELHNLIRLIEDELHKFTVGEIGDPIYYEDLNSALELAKKRKSEMLN